MDSVGKVVVYLGTATGMGELTNIAAVVPTRLGKDFKLCAGCIDGKHLKHRTPCDCDIC